MHAVPVRQACTSVSMERPNRSDRSMNIDMHFHFIPPFFVDELKRDNPWRKRVETSDAGNLLMKIGPLTFPLEDSHYKTGAMLETMDEMRIDIAAVSPSPVMFHNHMNADLLVPLYRRINDHLIDMAAQHPDRFKPLGTVAMQSPGDAVAEVHRIMDAGLSGIEIETNIAGKNLDAPDFLPIFEAAEQRGALVFLHPLAVLGADRQRDYYLANLIGNPTDTAVAAASLIFGGVMDRFPDLNVVLPHGGGSTPCLCGRWDHGASVRPELAHVEVPPSETIRRFHFDTLTHSEAALSLLIEVVGADRLVLGSDHPYDMGDPDLVARIENRSDLTEAQRAAILGGNAARLLGIARA